jgi:hypothetical protein
MFENLGAQRFGGAINNRTPFAERFLSAQVVRD